MSQGNVLNLKNIHLYSPKQRSNALSDKIIIKETNISFVAVYLREEYIPNWRSLNF